MIGDALFVMIVGMSVVFSALGFFYIIILLINKFDFIYNNFKVNKKLQEFAVPSENSAPISDELIAVISAAVFETYNKKVRIHPPDFEKYIKPLSSIYFTINPISSI